MQITHKHPLAKAAQILLNGQDITPLALAADSDQGYADIVLLNHKGKVLTDDVGMPIVTRVNGRVIIGFRRAYVCLADGATQHNAKAFAEYLKRPSMVPN